VSIPPGGEKKKNMRPWDIRTTLPNGESGGGGVKRLFAEGAPAKKRRKVERKGSGEGGDSTRRNRNTFGSIKGGGGVEVFDHSRKFCSCGNWDARGGT